MAFPGDAASLDLDRRRAMNVRVPRICFAVSMLVPFAGAQQIWRVRAAAPTPAAAPVQASAQAPAQTPM